MFPKSKQSVFTFDSLLPYFYVFLKYSFLFGKWVTIVTLHEYHSCNWIYTHSNFLFCKFHLRMLRYVKWREKWTIFHENMAFHFYMNPLSIWTIPWITKSIMENLRQKHEHPICISFAYCIHNNQSRIMYFFISHSLISFYLQMQIVS